MATLEKIRSKSVLLVVIIAVALLAFILGDAITNGRNLFGNDTTVAKVGKDKIEYQEYQQHRQRVDEARRLAQQQGQEYPGIYDDQQVSQVALQQLMMEKLIDNAVEDMGMKSSPELLRYYMIENPGELQEMIPEMNSLLIAMNQSGIPVNTPEEAYIVVTQPTTRGYTDRQVQPFLSAWVALEGKYSQAIARDMYAQLFNNSFKANDLDIAAMRNHYTKQAQVKVAKKEFDEENTKNYKVSDDELKKAYEESQERYVLNQTAKEISFIEVSIVPSAQDIADSKKLALTVAADLKKAKADRSKEVLRNINLQDFQVVPSKVTDYSLRNFLETARVDSVAVLSNGDTGFTVAKLTKRNVDVDSVEVASMLMPDDAAFVKRVLAYATSGQSLDSITDHFSADSLQFNLQWADFYNGVQSMPKNLGIDQAQYDSLFNNPGKFIEIEKANGYVAYGAITQKSEPKIVADYEIATYELHPSDATIAQAREKLEKYLATNNTAEKFEKNAKASNYTATTLLINSENPAIPSGRGFYPDSRSVVRWAMIDGKDGEVSKVFQNRNVEEPVLYAAAVIGTYKDYLPWSSKQVKDELTAEVKNRKAGEAMAKQYKKATVEESAKAMGVDMETASINAQGNMMISDAKVRGRILGSKPSDKVQVVNGDDGVYVFVVTDSTNEPVEMTDDNFSEMVLRMYRQNVPAVLLGKKKIENNIYKFEVAE